MWTCTKQVRGWGLQRYKGCDFIMAKESHLTIGNSNGKH